MKELPDDFKADMAGLISDNAGYSRFMSSYEDTPAYGLRMNPAVLPLYEKYNKEHGEDFPFSLKEIPWCNTGYYAEKAERPGRSVLHEAGLFYIQEPSAMLPAYFMCARPGERILDLCAAPGGKTSQLAGDMKNRGLLVSNEIIKKRTDVLARNIERMGISCAVVTNETPERLSEKFPESFDGILVDAPCSGEGMFRKDEGAVNEWSRENVLMCAQRQKDILKEAVKMLKYGGRLVYSTCTFSKEENEDNVKWLLETFPELIPGNWEDKIKSRDGEETLNKIKNSGISHGISEISEISECSARIWPHRAEGEGHFAAILYKGCCGKSAEKPSFFRYDSEAGVEKSSRISAAERRSLQKSRPISAHNSLKNAVMFIKENFSFSGKNIEDMLKRREIVNFGSRIYLLPEDTDFYAFRELKVQAPGICAGVLKKERFEPDHFLAKAAPALGIKAFYTVETTQEEAETYLRGMTLKTDKDIKGWCTVTYHGLNLGWGKAVNGTVKNHYPKGLRIL